MTPAHVPSFTVVRTDRDVPVVDLGSAPLPTPATLRARQSVPRQVMRFVSFSVRILRMVVAGHRRRGES